MLYPLYTNKQINIPYLLKIGDGKVKKIGKYLADKNLTNAVIFWSEGIQRLLADRLYPGLEENGVKAVYEQDVRFINIEEITKITFSLPKAAEVIVGIGGGKVLAPRPLRHKRHDLAVLDSLILREQGSGSQRLLQAAEEFGVSLPDSSQLAERSGLDTGTAVSLLADLLNQGKLTEPLPGRYAAASALDTLWDRCRELLSAYHQKHPLHAGMPAAELRQKLFRQITPAEGDALLEVFRAEGRMKRAENRWALAEFSIRLTKRQTALRDALLERFLRGGPEPDTVEAVLDSIPPERREEARQVLESLLTGGELVRLSPELCWHREVFQKGLDILRTLCADHGAVTLAEVRDAFDTTRKYALLFLEACDRRQITVREGDCRRLKLKFHD